MDCLDFTSVGLGLSMGLLMSLVFVLYYRQKLLEKSGKQMKVEIVYILTSLRAQLEERDNKELYFKLSAISTTYKVPDIDEAKTKEEAEKLQHEAEKLDNYLGLLELCCEFCNTDVLNNNQIYALLGDRLSDIRHNTELYSYINDSPFIYAAILRCIRNSV